MIYLVALIFPWLAFILKGNLGLGLFCLFLQITIIGWLPATIWAIVYINNQKADERNEKIVNAIKNTSKR
ncbi:YqaE/Pmp3 family membrane protein [Reichenbachiella carrageenanivorans]|uniref:YqaE/Pmp3 family membrane protein n=1 Tax=Reichenbachiella carrageenanivorans TaxID=2979869 RepID=UPI00389A1AE3